MRPRNVPSAHAVTRTIGTTFHILPRLRHAAQARHPHRRFHSQLPTDPPRCPKPHRVTRRVTTKLLAPLTVIARAGCAQSYVVVRRS
jgi:hypothetical protein